MKDWKNVLNGWANEYPAINVIVSFVVSMTAACVILAIIGGK